MRGTQSTCVLQILTFKEHMEVQVLSKFPQGKGLIILGLGSLSETVDLFPDAMITCKKYPTKRLCEI